MAQTPIQIRDMIDSATTGFNGFVDVSSTISVPNTQVVNRAKIPNIVGDLKVKMGTERLHIQAIQLVQGEAGPSGEPVKQPGFNDDYGLVRFVGAGWVSQVDNAGAYALTANNGDFVEMVFCGTGLALLISPVASMDLRVTVDGGSEGANIINASISSTPVSRGYAANTVKIGRASCRERV
jgi:hypothetical protein